MCRMFSRHSTWSSIQPVHLSETFQHSSGYLLLIAFWRMNGSPCDTLNKEPLFLLPLCGIDFFHLVFFGQIIVFNVTVGWYFGAEGWLCWPYLMRIERLGHSAWAHLRLWQLRSSKPRMYKGGAEKTLQKAMNFNCLLVRGHVLLG